MASVVVAMLILAGMPGQQPVQQPGGSFLDQAAFAEDLERRLPVRPYVPQPGDLMFSADRSAFWTVMHKIAGTSHPTHCGIVFQRPDGSMAILEAGPHDTLHIETMDAIPHLHSYEMEGRVWIRQRAVPLTPEQSARLTEFAKKEDGKRFALVRLGQQLTIFRARGPLKTYFVGKPHGPDRSSYYCAELAMESCVYAGLIDGDVARPCATYPRDFFMDASLNPYLNSHLHLAPNWYPPARWTSGQEAEIVAGK